MDTARSEIAVISQKLDKKLWLFNEKRPHLRSFLRGKVIFTAFSEKFFISLPLKPQQHLTFALSSPTHCHTKLAP